jgi:urease accessory protein
VFGNVFLLTPKVHAERILAACESMVDLGAGLAAGTGRLPAGAGLVHKILGMEAAQVRAKLREFWALVRTELTGARLGAEFLWA